MNDQKMTREQAIKELEKDDHYKKKEETNVEKTKKNANSVSGYKTIEERKEYKKWQSLKNAPEIAPNGKHYKENDIQFLMNDQKMTREQAIKELEKDDH